MTRWTYTGPGPEERRRLVLEILREHGGFMKSAELAQKLGCRQAQLVGSQKQATLTELMRDGLIQRVGNARAAKWMAYSIDEGEL